MSSSSPSSSSPSPVHEELKPHKRRTKFMIAQENKQILDYLVNGSTHDQIRKWVGLSERNYWKRIATIRKRGLELTKTEQTPEAHAFMMKRTDEKLHRLEVMAMEIANSKTGQVRDRLEAMRFLVQIYEDEMSPFLYGPSHLVKDASAASAGIADSGGSSSSNAGGAGGPQKKAPWPWPWNVDDDDIDEDDEEGTDDNAVF